MTSYKTGDKVLFDDSSRYEEGRRDIFEGTVIGPGKTDAYIYVHRDRIIEGGLFDKEVIHLKRDSPNLSPLKKPDYLPKGFV